MNPYRQRAERDAIRAFSTPDSVIRRRGGVWQVGLRGANGRLSWQAAGPIQVRNIENYIQQRERILREADEGRRSRVPLGAPQGVPQGAPSGNGPAAPGHRPAGIAGAVGRGVVGGVAGGFGVGGALVRGVAGVAAGGGAAVGAVAGLGFNALATGVTALTAVFRRATTEATAWAQSLSALRANSGMSSAQGQSLIGQNAVLGIDPARTAQIYGSPGNNSTLLRMRARSLGYADPTSPDGMAKLAEQYQRDAARGPLGRMRANAKLDTLYDGKAPEEVRNLVNQRPQAIREQLNYGRQIQQSFGIDPEMLRRYSEEIPNAVNRVAFAFNQAWLKIAVEVAPFLERTLGGVANFIGRNAGQISEAIRVGVSWLVEELPPFLLRGSAHILRGGAALLRGLASFATLIADNSGTIVDVLQAIASGLTNFVQTLQGLVNLIPEPIRNAVTGGVQRVGQLITGNNNETPAEQMVNTVAGGGAIRVAARVARPFLGPAARLIRPAARLVGRVFGIGSGAPPTPPGAPGPSLFGRIGGAVGRGVAWLRGTPVGSVGTATGRGVAMAARGGVVGLGVGAGVVGYEGLRRVVPAYEKMPSTFQIGRYYWNRMRGVSHEDAHRRIWGQPVASDQPAAGAPNNLSTGAAQGAANGATNGATAPNPGLQSHANGIIGNQNNANNINRIASATARGANAQADRAVGLANGLERAADNYEREMLAELRGIRQETKGVKAAISSNDGSTSGSVLNALQKSLARDSWLVATR